MGKVASITQEKIDAASAALDALAQSASHVLTTREAVERLRPKITELRRRGMPLEEIARVLGASGVQVTTATLKSYLRKPRKAATRQRPSSEGQALLQEKNNE